MTVKGTDAHSGIDEVEWVVDGGAPETDSPEGQFTISTDGEHTVQTLVRDVAGNESGWATHTVKIDRTAPDNLTEVSRRTGRSPPTSRSRPPTASPAWTASSGRSTAGRGCTGPPAACVHFTTTGEYQLRTRARDNAGNVSLVQVDDVSVDVTVPTNTTTVPGAPVGNPYQVAVTGTDADSGVGSVEWQIDGGADHLGRSGRSCRRSPATARTR